MPNASRANKSTLNGRLAVALATLALAAPGMVTADERSDIRDFITPPVVDAFNPDVTDANRGQATPRRGGTLRLRQPSAAANFNPLTYQTKPEAEVIALLFDALIGIDIVTRETYPKMAWGFAKADSIQLADGEEQHGRIIAFPDEDDEASTWQFVPEARIYTFNQYDIEEMGDNYVVLSDQFGGDRYEGRVTTLDYTVTVDEGYDSPKVENLLEGTVADLATWTDIRGDREIERAFVKRETGFWFFMRDGIEWEDGKPLTAEDVKFSYDIIMNVNVNAQRQRAYFANITKCEIQDDGGTVYFHNSKPYFQQFDFVAGIGVLPRHVFDPEQYGGDELALGQAFNDHPFRTRPVASGPYKLTQRRDGELVVLQRNDNYWASKLPAGAVPRWHPDQPYMDELRFITISEPSVAVRELLAGRVDADLNIVADTWFMDSTNTPEFTNRIVRARDIGFLYTYVGFNMENPIFADRDVRRALSMLIPREQIARDIHKGAVTLVSGPNFINGPGYDHSVEPVPYDPRAAQRLLRRAGWLDRDGDGIIEKEIDGRMVPFEFEYSIHTAHEYHSKVADIIKQSVEQAGIRMNIRRLDFSVLIERTRNKDFDAVRLAWGNQIEPDPYQIWHSSQAIRGGDNSISYSNPRVDELLENIREEFNPPARWAMAREVHRALAEDEAVAFMFAFYQHFFYNRGIHGVTFYPNQLETDYTEWWWANADRRRAGSN